MALNTTAAQNATNRKLAAVFWDMDGTLIDSEPYLAAGRLLGISAQNMKYCIAIEDSFAGLKSAAASGATTLAQRAYSNLDVSGGPQFADLDGYKDLTPQALERYIIDRIAQ